MTDRQAVLGLIDAASAIVAVRPADSDDLAAYQESADHALGHVLELVSALLAELASEDDPYQEIGVEPRCKEDAVRLVQPFVDRCREILLGEPPFPWMCISTRALTYALLFLASTERA
jgi:hypothetical protein